VKKLIIAMVISLALAFACLWPERKLHGLQCDHNLECLEGYICVDFYCVAEGVITDAGRRPLQSCDQAFGATPSFTLCEEEADSCALYLSTAAELSCSQVCAQVDVGCLDAQRSSAWEPCVALEIDPNDPNEPQAISCATAAADLICTCERPPEPASDAARPDLVGLTSCDARYSGVPGYLACAESVDTCEFYQSSGTSCEDVCTSYGGSCIEVFSSAAGGDLSCERQVVRSCTRALEDLICICTREAVAPLDASVPDTSRPDTLLPDTLRPDTLLPDTLLPDTLLPDTLLPDTSLPDTLREDAF